ncbi:MAG: hypothetical protein D6746_12230 [Bacteroidetes bacterium]|nr:MAG: hypothetical protein D6746_12230 [Bacteroidota bacterium]
MRKDRYPSENYPVDKFDDFYKRYVREIESDYWTKYMEYLWANDRKNAVIQVYDAFVAPRGTYATNILTDFESSWQDTVYLVSISKIDPGDKTKRLIYLDFTNNQWETFFLDGTPENNNGLRFTDHRHMVLDGIEGGTGVTLEEFDGRYMGEGSALYFVIYRR